MSRLGVICSFVSIIAVLVGFSVAAPQASATAMVVPLLTGNAVAFQSSGLPFGNFTINSVGGFASVPAIHATPPPTPCPAFPTAGTSCSWTWSGKLDGVGISFTAFTPESPLTFSGVITEGTFSGGGGWHCPGSPCDETLSEGAQLSFTGTWGGGIGGFGDGWFSKGSFTGNLIWQAGAVSLFNYRYSGPMETFTSRPEPVPEPSTLLMLGSGVIGLAAVIRRKLTS